MGLRSRSSSCHTAFTWCTHCGEGKCWLCLEADKRRVGKNCSVNVALSKITTWSLDTFHSLEQTRRVWQVGKFHATVQVKEVDGTSKVLDQWKHINDQSQVYWGVLWSISCGRNLWGMYMFGCCSEFHSWGYNWTLPQVCDTTWSKTMFFQVCSDEERGRTTHVLPLKT